MKIEISEKKFPTNKDVKLSYIPENSETYVYKLYKDGKVIDEKELKVESLNLNLVESGTYVLEIRKVNENNKIEKVKTQEIIIDKEAPEIIIKNEKISIFKGEKIDITKDVKVSDNYTEDITYTTNYKDLNLSKIGNHTLEYKVMDEAGNITSKEVMIEVSSKGTILMFQSSIIVICVIILMFVLKFIKGISLEQRISPYAICHDDDLEDSIFDNIIHVYTNIQHKLSSILDKSSLMTKLSKKYSKYVPLTDNHLKEIDFISDKIVLGLLVMIVSFVSQVFKLRILMPHEMLIPFIIGFFIVDVYYAIKYAIYYKQLENDLLQAVMIMNNAFKAGKSIVQAVSLVADELDSVVGREFNKMLVELNFGLDVNVVFERFSERIKLKEAEYLTSSLSILNQTGGDIVKIFNTIEKTMIEKRKLGLELEALTASSKIILYVLIIVPILFIGFISMIDPTYFSPFFESSFGLAIFAIVVILYMIYIYIVNKLMKVRM